MTTRLTARGGLFAKAGAALLASMALGSGAQAAPPAFTGAPVRVPLPAVGQNFVINLRGQGVLTGTPPVGVTVQGSPLLNGVPMSALGATSASTPPNACISITNFNYIPQPGDAITLGLMVSGQGSVSGTVSVVIDAGANVVDDQSEFAACNDPNSPPTVNAGGNRSVNDTDGIPGENVVLTGTATDPDGDPLTYTWYDDSGDTVIASGPVASVRLPDGPNTVTLRVHDAASQVEVSNTVVITVNSASGPTANAGPDRIVADTNHVPGESVLLDGTASTDADGTIASYQWFLQSGGSEQPEQPLGTGATLTVDLPEGEHTIRLQVTDNSGLTSSDIAVITVGDPQPATLAELPNLTPNQRQAATALDRICSSLFQMQSAEAAMTQDQRDLLARCNGLLFQDDTQNQVDALDELVPEDFAAARTQTLLFANTQYLSVMDRLIALRGGASGLSLAGLSIIVDGKMVPLAQLQEMAKELLGGGASADEPGGLLSDKWGLWARGNYSFGKKDQTASSPSFDTDQWSLVGGIDYRLSDRMVIGGSLAYGQSSIEFNPRHEGALDTTSWALSAYGSTYAAENFYLDAIINVASAGYDANRNITYVDGSGLVDADAKGDTDGTTYSGGLSAGYDFLIGGLTLSPNLGFFYIDSTIDSFAETGAGGLNLLYDEQQFKSLTGNLGLRATYAWNLSWGVLLPHLRVDYVREFEDDVDVFGVRFAADPNATSTPPILVQTDNPDESYWRLAAGFSAQFKFGLSGYIEYQRLESFQFISFQDVSVGLRMQRSF
jgi:outer membrane autotransporter protein